MFSSIGWCQKYKYTQILGSITSVVTFYSDKSICLIVLLLLIQTLKSFIAIGVIFSSVGYILLKH